MQLISMDSNQIVFILGGAVLGYAVGGVVGGIIGAAIGFWLSSR